MESEKLISEKYLVIESGKIFKNSILYIVIKFN